MMLASYFVYNGTKQALNPAPMVADAEPLADKFVPLAKSIAPEQVAGFIPNNTKSLVRLDGAIMAAGGLGLASGIGRRAGAGLIAAGMLPHVLAVNPNGGRNGLEKDANRAHFVRNLALLGGALIASQDTQGKPSLGWRASDAKNRLARTTDKKVNQLTANVDDMSKSAQKKLARAQKDAEKRAKKLQKQASKKASKLGDQVAELTH